MNVVKVLFIIVFSFAFSPAKADWRTADRSSTHIAPLPSKEHRAIVQIYAARAYGWRGYFAVHTWFATKEKDADHYLVYQVVGFRQWRGLPVVLVQPDLPDRKWFDHAPEIIFDLKGKAAEDMIPHIKQAAVNYPYQNSYILWPGPNSNTFTSYIMRHTPGIYTELPPHAIGKDWIDDGKIFGPSESGTGYQLSLFGAFGITIGKAEGIEINILGLTFGIDILRPALKLPFIGRVGLSDRPVYGPDTTPEKSHAPVTRLPHVPDREIKD
jgi:hypothetical protein